MAEQGSPPDGRLLEVVNDYLVTCGIQPCQIHVTGAPLVPRGRIFIAIPYLWNEHSLEPVADDLGHTKVITAEGEPDAVEWACQALERRLGPRKASPALHDADDEIRHILSPIALPIL
jgi:hypothetical protein